MSAVFWCPENGGCSRCSPEIMMVCHKKVAAICSACGAVMVHPNQTASQKAIDAGGCQSCRIKAKWGKMVPLARKAALEYWLRGEDAVAIAAIAEIDPRALTAALASSSNALSQAVQQYVWDEIGRSAEGRLGVLDGHAAPLAA